jgi:hypothetical protein
LAGATKARLYKRGDEDGIVRLFSEVFGREMTLEEWNWKYIESYPRKVYSSVAVHPEEGIVGHYGGLCLPFVYRRKRVHCLAICDVMIKEPFRGVKLLREIAGIVPAEAVRDGIRMGYGFPNSRNLLAPALLLGLYEKVEDVFEASKEISALRNTADRFLYELDLLDYTDEDIDELWETCEKEIVLSVIRDRKYFRWRYQRNPLYSYELWGLRRRWGGKLLGLAVLRRQDDRMLLVDFLCPRELLDVLFLKIENCAYSAGYTRIILWIPEYLASMVERLGFAVQISCTSIPRTTCEPTLQKDEIRGNFFYTMGDTYLF